MADTQTQQPMDALSQLISNLPEQGDPLLGDLLNGGMRSAAPAGAPPPMALPPPAIAPQPSDDPMVVRARNGLDTSNQAIAAANTRMQAVQDKINAVPTVDKNDPQYRPNWKDRLAGMGIGALAGFGGGDAEKTAHDFAYRRLERADEQRARTLEPLQSEYDNSIKGLPALRDQNEGQFRNFTAARQSQMEDRLAGRDSAIENSKNNRFVAGTEVEDPNSPTGWTATTFGGDNKPFAPKTKPTADPKNPDEALAAASKTQDPVEKARLTKLSHDMQVMEMQRRASGRNSDNTKSGTDEQHASADSRKFSRLEAAEKEFRSNTSKLDDNDAPGKQKALNELNAEKDSIQRQYEQETDSLNRQTTKGGVSKPGSQPQSKLIDPTQMSSWKGREGKILSLRQSGGNVEKWQLVKGVPTKIK